MLERVGSAPGQLLGELPGCGQIVPGKGQRHAACCDLGVDQRSNALAIRDVLSTIQQPLHCHSVALAQADQRQRHETIDQDFFVAAQLAEVDPARR